MCHGRIRRHPEELRQTAIKRFRSCHNVAHLAREIGIPRQTLYRWLDESEQVVAEEDGELVSAAKGRENEEGVLPWFSLDLALSDGVDTKRRRSARPRLRSVFR